MCCGHNRQQFRLPPRPSVPASRPVELTRRTESPSVRSGGSFEYTGKTSLTVTSPVTYKQYRFERPGARVPVDLRDRSWISTLPNLQFVAAHPPAS
jgi:hypothetical protein